MLARSDAGLRIRERSVEPGCSRGGAPPLHPALVGSNSSSNRADARAWHEHVPVSRDDRRFKRGWR